MNKIYAIYDDRIKPSEDIAAINGGRSFGKTVYKRQSLYQINLENSGLEKMFYLAGADEEKLRADIASQQDNTCFVFVNSTVIIRDREGFATLITKALYAREAYCIMLGDVVAVQIIPGCQNAIDYISRNDNKAMGAVIRDNTAFSFVGDRESFLEFITGGFDARFFNSLDGDYYTVTKKSDNKDKIKREYNFYYLLPDNMKRFFVQPFTYKDNGDTASYTMERCHTTDIAIRYVHGAVDNKELEDILKQLFYFIDERSCKECDKAELEEIVRELYIDKLDVRFNALKKCEGFEELNGSIRCGTRFKDITEIFDYYKKLYLGLTNRNEREHSKLVIGHGDLCFSNILYQKDAHLMKLIDPKGANLESEIYTDPYYDLAKLSHSICGGYDFFNSGMYDISVDEDMKLRLRVEYDSASAVELFKEFLCERGYSYELVRLYEASLFLSMLPLHMDRPRKVLGFILNAIDILDSLNK